MTDPDDIVGVEVVVSAADLAAELDYFLDELGFRIETISPADDPEVAVVRGHGLVLRLDRAADATSARLRVVSAAAGERSVRRTPNGNLVEVVPRSEPLELPPLVPAATVSRRGDSEAWSTGRAGMHYRDLIPDRQGGRFIASHIHVPGSGPVADWVHFHEIRFQLIYCYRGGARLVYEDQGEPFLFEAGDCVLQPPRIRHRVLESFDDLEVIEVGCPARHDTHADHEMVLPNAKIDSGRSFFGQRFVHHRARHATWERSRVPGYERRDTGIAAATGGLGGVEVLRPVAATTSDDAVVTAHEGELLFWFVLDGSVDVLTGGDRTRLGAGDSIVISSDVDYGLGEPTAELELLEVSLPAHR